ncbi:MAG: helix-turn-helix domain-containing protein [Deltaproteobacteria bacterium]|nr:helix-turn-helix domain-containing protein [Deltaproteobacteria bacterium]
MPPRPKTAFDRYFDAQMKDPAFAREYRAARAEIDAIDKLVRALDAARVIAGLSKADLARKVGSQPEMVRRLLTATRGNPTMGTVLKVASALGYHLELVPNRAARAARRSAPGRHAARVARARG